MMFELTNYFITCLATNFYLVNLFGKRSDIKLYVNAFYARVISLTTGNSNRQQIKV
jgi:hypothetical protein